MYVDYENGTAKLLVNDATKTVRRDTLVDNGNHLYAKNTDGSFTYFSGPYAGVTIYSDPQGTYSLNYDGSRNYITSTKPNNNPKNNQTDENKSTQSEPIHETPFMTETTDDFE